MITPLDHVSGRALSLPESDIDTDVIYPARFLLITEKRGLGRYAFYDRRGPEFGIDLDTGAPFLVAGANFGCGSSREHAVWALAGIGIRVVIAPSFGEIFEGNCYNNGILPLIQPAELVAALHQAAAAGVIFDLDLRASELRVASLGRFSFVIDQDRREALLNGWDEIGRIRALHREDIARFEVQQRRSAPWLWVDEEAVAPIRA